ncbi:TRAP transporter small permease [Martelella mediterranea]|uniref:TRAP transporter small permease protein n=1 Tax=Martelella mediterranea TaxID=293089 RepID=A0A4R3ND36_9HYPH|nr:TRAP transporter small permease [Martelella mediterranea]TCT28924.1 TRAP-type C4-dicarboxylate transport system permease small subunit [Martelella mediterranea]
MLGKTKNVLESLLVYLTSAMLAVMVCLMLWQVFTRYVLSAPALYTEELLRFTMIWMAFLGSAYAFGTRQHLALIFVVDALSGRKRLLLMLINDSVVLLFSVFILFIGGIKAVTSSMTQLSPIMRIPIGDVYMIMPITAVLIFILQLLNMAELIKEYNKNNTKPAEVI